MYVLQERRATDFEAPKLWKGLSGHPVDREPLINTSTVADRHLHNLLAAKSVDLHFPAPQSLPIDGFEGSKTVKGSVW